MKVRYVLIPCGRVYSMNLVSWNSGILVNYFNSTNDDYPVFDYLSPESSVLEPSNIPPFSQQGSTLSILLNGAGKDLWGLSNNKVNLYYYSSATNSWAPVTLSWYYNIKTIEWDSINDCLLVSVLDSTTYYSQKLLKITANNLSNAEILVDGGVATFGTINSVATIKQQTSTNYG